MDQGLPEAPKAVRWLAWVVACLLLAGLVSAGVLVAGGDRPGSAVVTAAGDRTTIDVTSTVTVPVPPSSTPPTTVATNTTRPRAAMDVLNAIGSTTTTTRPRATTTTRPPVATTTVPTPTTAPTTPTTPTTSTTAPAQFTATLVNEHPRAVSLIVNGRPFSLRPGQSLREDLPISSRGDLVQVRLADDDKCGVSDSGVIFRAGASYRVAIVPGETPCKDVVGPLLRIGPE